MYEDEADSKDIAEAGDALLKPEIEDMLEDVKLGLEYTYKHDQR